MIYWELDKKLEQLIFHEKNDLENRFVADSDILGKKQFTAFSKSIFHQKMNIQIFIKSIFANKSVGIIPHYIDHYARMHYKKFLCFLK